MIKARSLSFLLLSIVSGFMFWNPPDLRAAELTPVLVVGDSLSAAYGLPDSSQGWVALLQEHLRHRKIALVNASIPGDTSAGGRARLAPLLATHHPRVVILELGANDGLRGLSLSKLKANLVAMIGQARSAGAQVLVLGMKLPPNYGGRYADGFEQVYRELAKEQNVEVVPFFLNGVGGEARLLQSDGLHPNAQAQSILMNNVLEKLDPILTSTRQP